MAFPPKRGLEAIRLLAQTEAIFLDPVYTGKAMSALLSHIRTGVFTPRRVSGLHSHRGHAVALRQSWFDPPKFVNESAPGAAAETARFADVAVVGSGISGRSDFLTYEIPASLASIVERGLVVWAPVRDRLVTAIVFGTHDDVPEFDTRMLLGGDIRLRLSELQLDSAAWIATNRRHTSAQPPRCFCLQDCPIACSSS